MDVYGYPPYPYNQSDELAKQTFTQQALASSVPYHQPNPGMPEPHVMPAPTGAPWNVQGVPWGMPSPPEIVQFTAAARHSLEHQDGRLSPVFHSVVHCKRKSLDVEPVIPAKQRITEEKMAAHLNGLHISSDFTTHSLASNDIMDVTMDSTNNNNNNLPSTSTAEKLKGHTIVLADEIKKIREEPLLPAALIDRLEKPRMSLVVWKPRENILGTLKEDDSPKENEDSQRRNGVLATSHNVLEDVEM